MKLQFASNFPKYMPILGGLPTDFKAKLWQGFAKMDLNNLKSSKYIQHLQRLTPAEIALVGHVNPKYHTIRTDENDEIHPGTEIHFLDDLDLIIAPSLECTNTQTIMIDRIGCTGFWRLDAVVSVDGRVLQNWEVLTLSRNEGFDSPDDFFEWFDTDCIKKIIHWTEIKY
ncbi:hypothetical protein ACX0HA_08830 [Flavobacterium hauense]